MPRPPVACADCGASMFTSRGSLPQGIARCRSCRASDSLAACLRCGETFKKRIKAAKFCSRSCFARFDGERRRTRSPLESRVARGMRERDAPGLTWAQRARLSQKWRRQGRPCAYCDAPATTVDHVLPLVRGGTNFEGNLAPCCKRCNSSKGGYTVVEWRSGLRLAPMDSLLPWVYVARKPKAEKPPKPTHACPICSTETSKRITCSERCSREHNNRKLRDKYRAKVGLPINPNEPSRFWLRSAA